jgi:hypothetical protein
MRLRLNRDEQGFCPEALNNGNATMTALIKSPV